MIKKYYKYILLFLFFLFILIVFSNNGSDNYNFDDSTYNVFLLSSSEVEEYFANDDERKCGATAYAVKNGAYVNNDGCVYWWLRSPFPNDSGYVYYVYSVGCIFYYNVSYADVVVRPALWINL